MAHEHPAYGDEAHPCVELGHGVCIRPFRGDTFFIAHERNVPFDPAIHVSAWCEGSIPTRAPGEPHPADSASWERTGSLAGGDLTLTPSIQCGNANGCGGSHGFVTNGKWVPA